MRKKVRMIWCHYKRAWTPLGRSRKRCPVCGAVFRKGGLGHRVKSR